MLRPVQVYFYKNSVLNCTIREAQASDFIARSYTASTLMEAVQRNIFQEKLAASLSIKILLFLSIFLQWLTRITTPTFSSLYCCEPEDVYRTYTFSLTSRSEIGGKGILAVHLYVMQRAGADESSVTSLLKLSDKSSHQFRSKKYNQVSW